MELLKLIDVQELTQTSIEKIRNDLRKFINKEVRRASKNGQKQAVVTVRKKWEPHLLQMRTELRLARYRAQIVDSNKIRILWN